MCVCHSIVIYIFIASSGGKIQSSQYCRQATVPRFYIGSKEVPAKYFHLSLNIFAILDVGILDRNELLPYWTKWVRLNINRLSLGLFSVPLSGIKSTSISNCLIGMSFLYLEISLWDVVQKKGRFI